MDMASWWGSIHRRWSFVSVVNRVGPKIQCICDKIKIYYAWGYVYLISPSMIKLAQDTVIITITVLSLFPPAINAANKLMALHPSSTITDANGNSPG